MQTHAEPAGRISAVARLGCAYEQDASANQVPLLWPVRYLDSEAKKKEKGERVNKAEKVALIELGLTEEQLAERGAKVSAMISEPISTAQEYTITDKGTGGATPFDAPVILTRA